MTTDGLNAIQRRSRGSLTRRLLAAFVMVSIASVIVFGVLGIYAVTAGLSKMTEAERHKTAARVEWETATAYRAAGGWNAADLSRAQRTAWTVGARVTFADGAGRYVGGTLMSNRYLTGSDSTVLPVDVGGDQVGSVRIWFSGDEWAARQARSLLWRWGLVALLVSTLVSVTASFTLSRRIVRPLRRLTEASERFRRGDRTARAGYHDAPGEIGDLAAALDDGMDTVVAEDAARRRMTGDIAHEIRTPLAGLQAGLEELRDGYLDVTPDRLAELHDGVLRLGRVVDDLAVLASAESARLSLKRTPLDLAQAAQKEVTNKEAFVRAAELVLETTLGPAPVVGDADRLAEVVGNLLVNTARYCRPGDHVHVTTGMRGATAYLTVADTGPGIPSADLPHVFDRLYRGANASHIPGSGIGLAIVRELVEAHDGVVTISSPPRGGTTVSIDLPRSDRGTDHAAAESFGSDEPRSEGRPRVVFAASRRR